MEIKVISLWQPWASLMALGAKRFETRHWTTDYRGTIAIHAARHRDDESEMYFEYPEFAGVLRKGGYRKFDDLPLGAVIAIADFTHIFQTEKLKAKISAQERDFGNYADGRFAWWFQNARMIEPIPLRGEKGLFDWVLPTDVKYLS